MTQIKTIPAPPVKDLTEYAKEAIEDVDLSSLSVIYGDPELLSPDQIEFCMELIANGYKKTEAVKAVYSKYYENKSSGTNGNFGRIGSDLMKMPKIKRFLHEQLMKRATTLQMTADHIAQQYYDWSRVDVTEYINVIEDEVTLETKRGKRIKQKIPRVELKRPLEEMPEKMRRCIKRVYIEKGELHIEFVDQKAALDSLVKVLGITNNDLKLELNAPITLNFDRQDEDA